MKILIVDDDPAILKLCATALSAQGHECTTCNAGNSALAAALTGTFDLALCDLNLPDVHGLEIVRAIKMQAPDLPVIVISALDPREWSAKSTDAGADHFLQKPLRLDVLRHEVAMAAAARMGGLSVCLHDDDVAHRGAIERAFTVAGCRVVVVESPMQIVGEDPPPDLVILDASAPGAEAVVRWAGVQGVHCFALLEKGKDLDDKLMRMGAGLIVAKPVDPEALLIQARFLASRRRP